MLGIVSRIHFSKMKLALIKALRILENPSIPEIRTAAMLSPRLLLLSGLSYQRIYSELRVICTNKQAFRVTALHGHPLRFSIDPAVSQTIRRIIKPIPQVTRCNYCGSVCLEFRQTIYNVDNDKKCSHCDNNDEGFFILSDNYYACKYIIYNNIIFGVFDYYRLRLPGSIRGYGTEYKRATDLLEKITGEKTILAVVGQIS